MSNISQIEVSKLYPHPKNPRLDVGDVTELADSIKTKGVLQNLTVVKGGPGVPDGEDGYTVIIGHRRRAGALAAGIKTVPCAVAEMDEKEQVSTMLLENMQRTDLTIYEQAQGIQMMLDLGSTVKDISDKTGFSVSTIDRRRKLLTLDKDKFKESQSKNATLEDYLKVSEIEDEKERNKVLGFIGTNNFDYQLKIAIDNQEKRKMKQKIMAVIPDDAIIVTDYTKLPEYNERETVETIFYHNNLSENRINEIRNELSKCIKPYIYDNGYNIVVYKKIAPKNLNNTSANSVNNDEYRKKHEEIQRRVDGLKAIGETAFGLRKEFFESLKVTKQNIDKVLKFCFMATSNDASFEFEVSTLCSLMDIDYYSDEELEKLEEEGNFDYYEYEEQKMKECAEKNINQALYLKTYLSLEDYNCSTFHTFNAQYYKSLFLIKVYDLLKMLGYQISDDEQKYIDGSHELYAEVEE